VPEKVPEKSSVVKKPKKTKKPTANVELGEAEIKKTAPQTEATPKIPTISNASSEI